jgi:hypothetical protein
MSHPVSRFLLIPTCSRNVLETYRGVHTVDIPGVPNKYNFFLRKLIHSLVEKILFLVICFVDVPGKPVNPLSPLSPLGPGSPVSPFAPGGPSPSASPSRPYAHQTTFFRNSFIPSKMAAILFSYDTTRD